MIKIALIGFGNLAQHLAAAFWASPEINLVEVFSRSDSGNGFPYHFIDDLGDLSEADLYLISVSDAAVAEVLSQLPFQGKLVAHTAGSLPMEMPSANRKAVFYPLQTFSKDKAVDFSLIPVCLEAGSAQDYALLEKAAKAISGFVYPISSLQRRSLHVSAVFVSNFTNHLYKIGSDICAENGVPFDILRPLIAETSAKIQLLSPQKAQTGPAIRGDENTIAAHLESLSDDNQKDIYKLLTKSIQNDRKKL